MTNRRFIYADHAATTQLLPEALDAMLPYLDGQYGNPSSVYMLGVQAHKVIECARAEIASLIGAYHDEIYFTSGGSESDNWAIKETMKTLQNTSSHIVTSCIEHHAILHACLSLELQGVDVSYLPVNKQGILGMDSLQQALRRNTSLVSVMLANNEIGTIQPIKDLSNLAHKKNSLFHTDAVQAMGHIPINVHDLGVDMLSASAHKFNGPRGIGFFYLRRGVELLPLIDGGTQERKKRAGTENTAGIVGMLVALKKNIEKLEETSQYLNRLTDLFKATLLHTRLDYIFNGAKYRIPGSISVSFKNANGEMLLHRLDLMGIAVSTGSACNSHEDVVSHVLKAIQVPDEYVKGTIRITLGIDNTEDDVITIVDALKKILL